MVKASFRAYLCFRRSPLIHHPATEHPVVRLLAQPPLVVGGQPEHRHGMLCVALHAVRMFVLLVHCFVCCLRLLCLVIIYDVFVSLFIVLVHSMLCVASHAVYGTVSFGGPAVQGRP